MLDALSDHHHLVREYGIRELDEFDYAAAVPTIEALCTDPHPDVRAAALAAIANLGPADSAIPLLLDALQDPDATVRFTAVNHLGGLDQFTDRTTLERMLDDPEKDVREHTRHILDRNFPDIAE